MSPSLDIVDTSLISLVALPNLLVSPLAIGCSFFCFISQKLSFVLLENGNVVCAGGITDENGKPIGSFLVLEFASKELFDAYLESEPYIKYHVWEEIKVETCNVVIMNNEMVGA